MYDTCVLHWFLHIEYFQKDIHQSILLKYFRIFLLYKSFLRQNVKYNKLFLNIIRIIKTLIYTQNQLLEKFFSYRWLNHSAMHVLIFSWIFSSIETMNKTQKKKRNISNIKVMKCLKNSIFSL